MQISRILITNNTTGNHAPEKWAMVTADMIAESTDLTGDRLIEANRLQLKFADVLLKHHADVQVAERASLAADAEHVLSNLFDALSADVKSIVAELVDAAKGTLWEAHYARSDVQEAVGEIVANHLRSSMHVERLCHADQNPACPHAQAYKAMHFGGAN